MESQGEKTLRSGKNVSGDRGGYSQTKMIPVPPAQEVAEFLYSHNLQEEFSDLQMSTCSTLVCFCRQWLQQQ